MRRIVRVTLTLLVVVAGLALSGVVAFADQAGPGVSAVLNQVNAIH
jgi:hypothetical protein